MTELTMIRGVEFPVEWRWIAGDGMKDLTGYNILVQIRPFERSSSLIDTFDRASAYLFVDNLGGVVKLLLPPSRTIAYNFKKAVVDCWIYNNSDTDGERSGVYTINLVWGVANNNLLIPDTPTSEINLNNYMLKSTYDANSDGKVSYTDLSDKPVLGTASALNVAVNGDAGITEVVKGDDTRLTNPSALSLTRQIRNQTGSTLTKGTVVYISGASGNKALVSRAIATSDATSAQTFGVVQEDILTNNNGNVVVKGELSGLNTSTYSEGTQLYLSPSTAGSYTATKPVAPSHMVYIGVVTRSHVNQGQIEVSIQNGYEIDELHDVLIVSKINRDVLSYDSATSLWKNKQLTSADISDFQTAVSAIVASILGG